MQPNALYFSASMASKRPRPVEPCEHKSGAGGLTVATFNVLAEAYASGKPQVYRAPWSVMRWVYRCHKLLSLVLKSNATVVCLQARVVLCTLL